MVSLRDFGRRFVSEHAKQQSILSQHGDISFKDEVNLFSDGFLNF